MAGPPLTLWVAPRLPCCASELLSAVEGLATVHLLKAVGRHMVRSRLVSGKAAGTQKPSPLSLEGAKNTGCACKTTVQYF